MKRHAWPALVALALALAGSGCSRDGGPDSAAGGAAAEAEMIRRAEASVAAAERAERAQPQPDASFPPAPGQAP